MRIQKSLILDFDLQSAQDSAFEEWKIVIERELHEKKNSATGASETLGDKEQKNEPYLIEFERLSEFFFDLCLSWCQHLELEVFLYLVNGVFLNITKGSHVNVSEFKPLEEIEVLSIEFFNQLLNYRSKFENIAPQDMGYQAWYNRNFTRQTEIVRSVEAHLTEAFREKSEGSRILDLWMDMPTANPNHNTGYIT